MTEEEIQLRINKLKSFVARNSWTITDAAAREYVLLEAKSGRTETESARKREIMLHSMGRPECTCQQCQNHNNEEE